MSLADGGHPRRLGSSCFWFILGVIFACGHLLPHWLTGILVLVMVGIDGAGCVGRGSSVEATKAEQAEQARRLKDRIFIPVLVIPFVTVVFAAAFC